MTIAFDIETIRALGVIMRETGLTEIEVKEGEVRMHLVRAAPSVVHAAPVHVAPGHVAPAATMAMPVDEPVSANAVMSPMVGIAYLAPEPGATPFIVVGQAVAAGQTVLLIEAMKTFNQIKAPHAGTVTRILVTSGEPVEYDQPLLVIE